jgi:polyribonucleotide nucleotidyltransferase
MKRESRPTDEAVLTARMIDRAIRPLFPKDFKKEVLDKIDIYKILTNKVKTNNKIYKIVSDLFKPRHYKIGKDYYINSCKGLLHKNYKN